MPITIRRIDQNDEPLVSRWLENDYVHQKLGLKFEDVLAKNTQAYLISAPEPIMAVRIHKALRVAIQFGDSPYKSAKYSRDVVEWFLDEARREECREVIIRPGGGSIRFADKLGFSDFSGSKYLEVK